MSDILADARRWIAAEGVGETMGRTHDTECHQRHLTCLVTRLADEVARLRQGIDALLESQMWGVACKPSEGTETGERPNLYLLARKDDCCYGNFDAIIVAAESEADAVAIKPDTRGTYAVGDGWTTPENIEVTLVGVAAPGIDRGVILESYIHD